MVNNIFAAVEHLLSVQYDKIFFIPGKKKTWAQHQSVYIKILPTEVGETDSSVWKFAGYHLVVEIQYSTSAQITDFKNLQKMLTITEDWRLSHIYSIYIQYIFDIYV